MSGRRMLVVGAHSADFVWRAAGAIACHTAAGGEAVVVALSYGERGESGELWKQPDQTEDNVKRIRHTEAEKAATAVGARFEAFDLGDYPLRVGPESVDRL
ncbi:MAG TPA: PIG-L family deacetylase, partial [Actinomadura sp.]|nr:PIG-L family deacetylase [Actinomadura sp.]